MTDDHRHIPVTIRLAEPQRYAKGGLVKAANDVKNAGRYGDDMVVHVNKDEFAAMRKEWGEPTINPETGLPEFFLGGLQKWFQQNPLASVGLSVAGSLLGGNLAGSALSSLTDGAVSGTTANALGGGLLGAGIGGLTGGGQGALLGGLAGGITPYATSMFSGGGGGSDLLSGIFGGGSSSGSSGSSGSDVLQGGGGDATMKDSGGSSSSGGGLSSLFSSKNAIPLALGALAMASGFASKKPSAAQQAAASKANAADAAFNAHLASTVPFQRQQQQLTPEQYHRYGYGPGQTLMSNNQLPATLAEGGRPQAPQVAGMDAKPIKWADGEAKLVLPTPPKRISPFTPIQGFASGGSPRGALSVANSAPPQHAGTPTGNYVRGPGDGRQDKIPSLLSNNEYVMDAETVSMLGNGSPDAGAKALDQLRSNLRKHKGKALAKGKISPDAKPPAHYMGGRV